MPKDTYPVEYGKKTWRELENIERIGYDMPEIFTDFVNFVLNALLSLTDNMKRADFKDRISDNRLTGMYEDRYMEIIAKYKENKTRTHGQPTTWHRLFAGYKSKLLIHRKMSSDICMSPRSL